jgi:hypothetical protein
MWRKSSAIKISMDYFIKNLNMGRATERMETRYIIQNAD